MSPTAMPYWRLSAFYLFYFASLGALVPYWSLYLKQIGFSALEIGQLMAVIMATKVVSPNVWGWIADKTGKRMAIVRLGSLLAIVFFAGVFLTRSYWPLAGVMLLFSFFWNATLPQFEANTLAHLGAHHHRYSIIRLWGSIGFIATVAVIGPVLDLWSAALLPPILMALFLGIWLSSLVVPEYAVEHHPLHEYDLWALLRRPKIIALLLVCFLMQASHGPYYTFYTIYMEGYGYSRSLIGQLWALGVVAEVGIFLVMHRMVPRYGLRRLMLSAFALTTLRWVLIGLFPLNFPVVLFAQLLHAFSFGVFHAVAIALFHRYFVGRHQGRGQALYASISFGAGGAVGALYSGITWDWLGGNMTYLFASLLTLCAYFVTWRWIRPE